MRRIVRSACVALTAVVLVATLTGCTQQDRHEWANLAMPDPATTQGEHVFLLWRWAWVAALVTGAVVWGLIFYASWRFRRRSDDEVPIQTRYNLPLEIFYTIAPVIMVVVFFSHTVRTQDLVLKDEPSNPPDNIIEVTGEQWSWTFNYGLGEIDQSADDNRFDDHFSYQSYVHDGGTGSYIPELWLPVNETTRFNLHSPDVIHDFGIPSFLMRMDVVPGRVNHYVITPTRTGTFRGRCYELCGVYHSRMLFNVKVTDQASFDAHMAELKKNGNVGMNLGGSAVTTVAGLDEHSNGGEE